MELDQIRAFVFAVQEGSVLGASRRLHRSQPAVTRLIQSLEQSLGGALLDRSTRPATPTEFGKQVLEQALRTLEAADRLAGQGRNTDPRPSPIHLGVSHAYTRIVASAPMSQALKAPNSPALMVQTGWSHPLLKRLIDRTLDAALIAFPPGWEPPEGLRSQRVRREALSVIAPKDLLLPERIQLKDLALQPWVLNSDGCGLRARLLSEFANAGRSLSLHVEVAGSLSQHIDFVAAGFGLGLVPDRALAIHPLRRSVRRVRLKERLATDLWLLWRDLDHSAPAAWSRMRAAILRSATAKAL